jgi:F-type H+/Na+-transporting ATPase subunit alpha
VRLSPDEMMFWQHGFLKLNATIVFTWGLMLVLAISSKLITCKLEHGRRIRACLKQPEFAPVTVPAQIAILVALTGELFDRVPLAQMPDAEHAVQEAAANIPAEVSMRFETGAKLTDEDRKTIIEIARQALARFQPKPEPKAEPKPKSESKPEESKPESKPKAAPQEKS